MPDRKTHLYYSYKIIRELGLNIDYEAASIIQTLIDYPRKLPKKLIEYINEKCGNPLLEAWQIGMRIKGFGSHDWMSEKGRKYLKEIVRCLYGEEATILVDLHFELDEKLNKNPK